MKKIIRSLVLSTALLISTLLPFQRSDAAIGVGLSVGAVAFGGAMLMIGGAGGMAFRDFLKYSKDDDVAAEHAFVPSVIAIFTGLIVLDSSSGTMTFDNLTIEDAKKLNTKIEDVIDYNSELEEARASGESIAKYLISKFGQEQNVDFKLVEKVAQKQWNNICQLGQLTAGTCRVINAIRSQKISK